MVTTHYGRVEHIGKYVDECGYLTAVCVLKGPNLHVILTSSVDDGGYESFIEELCWVLGISLEPGAPPPSDEVVNVKVCLDQEGIFKSLGLVGATCPSSGFAHCIGCAFVSVD